MDAKEVESDWLDCQCNSVFLAIRDLDLHQKIQVIEQVLSYLMVEQADGTQ